MKYIKTESKITSLENVKQVVVLQDTIRVDYFGGENSFIKPKKGEVDKTLEMIYEELRKEVK